MPFDFAYSVNDPATANQQSHKAVSDGDVTRGEYRVALPDGRTQIVRYTADWKNGYNAEVKYILFFPFVAYRYIFSMYIDRLKCFVIVLTPCYDRFCGSEPSISHGNVNKLITSFVVNEF